MSRRTLAALVVASAGGWIMMAACWISDRRRLRAAEEELARWRREHQPPATPLPLRADTDMASEWEQAVAPMDS